MECGILLLIIFVVIPTLIFWFTRVRRNCRQGVDLVFDDVEKELLRERELIYGIKEQLEELLDKVVLQIRRLRAFVYNLTVDLRYKQNTLKIEEYNGKLDGNHIDTSVLNDKNVFKPA